MQAVEVFRSNGYAEGDAGSFCIMECEGSFFAEEHTGDESIPAQHYKLDVETVVMSSVN